MVKVEHISKRFGRVVAVDDVSFHVNRGEIVGLLGPNGAGKTTTLRLLSGFLCPTAGRITIADKSVVDEPIEARRQIGYLPEHAALYTDMRVEEYLAYRARLKGVWPRRVRARVDEVMELCGVTSVRRRIIGQLSKGFRQRVALADALVHEPPLLILDEPTLGLDPNQNRQVRDLIRALADRHTIVLSSHILPEVEQICHRVVILHRGRLLADGPVPELAQRLRRPRRLVVQVRAPAAEVREALSSWLGPALGPLHVDELSGGWCEARFQVEGEDDPRPTIARQCLERRWDLRELRTEELSLEQIFVALTSRAPELA